MKHFLFYILLMATIAPIGAQTGAAAFEERSDPKATKILEQLKQTYQGYKSVEAQFTLTIALPEMPLEVQKGKMTQKGEKYHVDMGEQAIYSDGNDLWFHLKKKNEVQINSLEEDSGMEMLSPKDLVTFYETEDFLYGLTNEGYVNGKMIQQIEFKPTTKGSDYIKMRLTIDKKQQQPLSIEVFSRDGSRYILEINKMTPNKGIEDAFFVFDASQYPDIHVEDLRID